MTDVEVVILSVVAAAGAIAACDVPLWCVGVVCIGCALIVVAVRRPEARIASIFVVTFVSVTCLAARAEHGLADAASGTVLRGVAIVRTDPEVRPGGVVFDVSLSGHRYSTYATGEIGRRLSDAEVGDEFNAQGTVAKASGAWEWLASRHISGQLRLRDASIPRGGAWWARSANWVRSLVNRGVQNLDDDARALFSGLLFGDDRAQSELERYRFRASGLSHLLAVSGQNVAFLLLAASPLLRRMRLTVRWVATIGLVSWFAVVTRLEPSVLRACAVVIVGATAAMLGRFAGGLRIISIAVVGLLVLDPLLVWSMGFRLSVGAVVAILTLARPLAAAIPGPAWLSDALSVTLAAQVGTAPMLVALAGSVPAFGPVWNLASVPVAGLLMTFGVIATPIAALSVPLCGQFVTALVDLPIGWLCRWLSAVAAVGADSRWPRLGVVGTWAMVGAVLLLALFGTRDAAGKRAGTPIRHAAMRVFAVLVLLISIGDLVGLLPNPDPPVASGVQVRRSSNATVLIVAATASEAALLRTVTAARLTRIDAIFVLGGGRRTSGAVWSLRQVADVGTVFAADPSTIRDALPLSVGDVDVGSLRVQVSRNSTGSFRVKSAT